MTPYAEHDARMAALTFASVSPYCVTKAESRWNCIRSLHGSRDLAMGRLETGMQANRWTRWRRVESRKRFCEPFKSQLSKS